MNHDYAHCMDYTENCPKECFRGQLVRDLDGVPINRVRWTSFKGTDECKDYEKGDIDGDHEEETE